MKNKNYFRDSCMGRKVGKPCGRLIKSREIMWAAHVARVGEKRRLAETSSKSLHCNTCGAVSMNVWTQHGV